MRLVHNDGKVLSGSIFYLIIDDRELLQCGDDDTLAIVDRIFQILRGFLLVDGYDSAYGVVKAGNSSLQLLIQHAAVGNDNDAVKNSFIILIVQARHAVCRPGDGVGLATSCTVLDEIVMSRTVLTHMSHQFSDNIQLMVAGEDDFGFGLNSLGTIRILGFLFFLLDIDKLLDDVQQLVLLPDFFPEVAGHVVTIICRRIACTAVPACAVAALIKGEERRFITVDNSCHRSIIKINSKVGQNALVLTKARFLGITVIHPLAFSVIDGLAGELIFQFDCHNRNAVQRQHHINRIVVCLRVMPLPDALADILFIILHRQCVQGRLRCKIADGELNTTMLEAVA